jgi:hypothetical protein
MSASTMLGAGTIGGGLLSGIGQFFGAQSMADLQRQGLDAILANQRQGIGAIQGAVQPAVSAITGWGQQGAGFLEPFAAPTQAAGTTLQSLLTPGPQQTEALMDLPGVRFMLGAGSQAINNAATAGSGLGGNELLALQNFGQQSVAQPAWQTELSGLQNMYGTGATTMSNLAQLLQGIGTNVGGVYTGAAGQQAQLLGNMASPIQSGYTGLANITGQGIMGPMNTIAGIPGQLGNQMMMQQLINKLA